MYKLEVKHFGDNYQLLMHIDHQSFYIDCGTDRSKKEVYWYKRMLKKALERLVVGGKK